jgi:hypothetical protein
VTPLNGWWLHNAEATQVRANQIRAIGCRLDVVTMDVVDGPRMS